MVFTVVDGLIIATIVMIFETARRVAKRWWHLASSHHDPYRRFAEINAKSLGIDFRVAKRGLRSLLGV
jgi:hypothetical protein